MSSTSPANSSISTTPLVGGGSSSNNTATDEFHFPSDLISIQDRKDEALQVLRSDLMAALNKEVKSLDEDNWMFEGPRSHIHLISTADILEELGQLCKEAQPSPSPLEVGMLECWHSPKQEIIISQHCFGEEVKVIMVLGKTFFYVESADYYMLLCIMVSEVLPRNGASFIK
ncbi:protein SAMBA [Citrus sinensis]|nr:protein SAMBA [Citrus sinensis]